MNSPQLLMLSGIGPADHFQATGIEVVQELPGVGGNLHDYLAVAAVVVARRPISLVAAESAANFARFALLRKGMLTSNVGEAHAFVRTRDHLPGPDLELIFAPVPSIDHGLVRPAGHGFTIGVIALQPRSVGADPAPVGLANRSARLSARLPERP